jgi:hypothetical protein
MDDLGGSDVIIYKRKDFGKQEIPQIGKNNIMLRSFSKAG